MREGGHFQAMSQKAAFWWRHMDHLPPRRSSVWQSTILDTVFSGLLELLHFQRFQVKQNNGDRCAENRAATCLQEIRVR